MTQHHVGLDAQIAQQAVQRHAGGKHRFRGQIHVVDPGLQLAAGEPGQTGGYRINDLAGFDVPMIRGGINEIEPVPNLREMHGQFSQHVGVLRAFAWKQKGELAGRITLAVLHALPGLEGLAGR